MRVETVLVGIIGLNRLFIIITVEILSYVEGDRAWSWVVELEYWMVVIVGFIRWGAVVGSRRVLESSFWLLHCLP